MVTVENVLLKSCRFADLRASAFISDEGSKNGPEDISFSDFVGIFRSLRLHGSDLGVQGWGGGRTFANNCLSLRQTWVRLLLGKSGEASMSSDARL